MEALTTSYSHELPALADATDELSVSAPSSVLLPLCNSLGELNAFVAEEFLALASILQSNAMQARQIAGESHKITNSEATLRSGQSIAVLQQILSDAAGVTGMVDTSTAKMFEILSQVNALTSPLRRLAKIPPMLELISVFSRIEGGRIGDASVDVSDLSHNIDALAAEVRSRVDGMLEDADVLSHVLQESVRELNRFGQQERGGAAELIAHTQTVLLPALARYEASQAAKNDIDRQYVDFQNATSKVVMSLQSEDLARQRVEHIQEAIRRVASALDRGDSLESCAGILTLQRAQLADTRDLLTNAGRSIQSALELLGPAIGELASRTSSLVQQASDEGQSFSVLLQDGLDSVAEVFQQCSSSVKAVVSMVDGVLLPVKGMTGSASTIERIESSVRLISLNATVKSVQLGGAGAAMGVLASELHTVVEQSGNDTKQVLDGLGVMEKALAAITVEKSVSEGSLMTNGKRDIRGDLGGLSELVETSSREMVSGLEQVKNLAEGVRVDLKRGCELAVGLTLVTRRFDEQLNEFDRTLNQLGFTEDMATAAAAGNHSDALSKLYSMESERALHLKVFNGSVSAADTSTMAAHESAGEFGDDVELF